jgi:hypothetical protein
MVLRTGSRTLQLHGITIPDDSRFPDQLNMTHGWFYLHLLQPLDNEQVKNFADNGKIVFKPENLIQNGWFKLYLGEGQFAFARGQSHFVNLIPCKDHIKPDPNELQGVTAFRVEASEDWTPQAPIQARKAFKTWYSVKGASWEHIWEDPRVVSIGKPPRMVLH